MFENILSREELIALKLRAMYDGEGYQKYTMSRFEEYDLYQDNKGFLSTKNIITFSDLDGRLMALKPDVTLSIAKNTRASEERTEKLYYLENVYRPAGGKSSFREIPQLGLECFGRLNRKALGEVVCLAARTLKEIDENFLLSISHTGFILKLLEGMHLDESRRQDLLNCLRLKRGHEIAEQPARFALTEALAGILSKLSQLSGDFNETLAAARAFAIMPSMADALDELAEIYRPLEEAGFGSRVRLDFSLVIDADYYSGVVMQGFAPGAPRPVLAGGYYGALLKKFGKDLDAIGFAVYLDEVAKLNAPGATNGAGALTVALPKGRLGEKVLSLFRAIGRECPSEDSRKLILESPDGTLRFLLVKPSDVAIYVEHGAADLGVVGKDVLTEGENEVYELMDLKIGACRLAVAAPEGYAENKGAPLRVATKYPRTTKAFYAARSREIEVIELHGSIELAPLVGLSDVIVDIVESGATLRENRLAVVEELESVTARLIANKAGYLFRRGAVDEIVGALAKVCS